MSHESDRWYSALLDEATARSDAALQSGASWFHVRRPIDDAATMLAEVAVGARSIPEGSDASDREITYGIQFGRAYLVALRRRMRERVSVRDGAS